MLINSAPTIAASGMKIAVQKCPPDTTTSIDCRRGGELWSEVFTSNAGDMGIEMVPTASFSSESHGFIERSIRVVRHTLDRIKMTSMGQMSARELKYSCLCAENAIRNEIIKRGPV